MKLLKSVVLMLLISPLSALADDFSPFMCSENSIQYKGITCCLEDLTISQCHNIIDHQLSPQTLARVAKLQSAFDNNEFKLGQVPNCHWNARYYKSGDDTPLRTVDEAEMDEYLTSTHHDVSIEKPQVGDILSFVLMGEARDEIMVGPVPTKRWTSFETPVHSAIYLGNDLVFQKENIGTKHFSIANIERTRALYEKASTKYVNIRGSILIENWRLRNLQRGIK